MGWLGPRANVNTFVGKFHQHILPAPPMLSVFRVLHFVLFEGWRKSVGVEPTRDVERPSLDLKSRRPTGVRSSSI